MLFLRRKEIPWEVVDSREVDPVPTYYEDDDLEISAVSEADSSRTYVFEVNTPKGKIIPTRNAIIFARQQLLDQVFLQGFNIFLYESWRVTVYRRGKLHRIEVYYSGRAHTLSKADARKPPFLTVLQSVI